MFVTRQTRSTSTESGTDPGEVSIETVLLIPAVMFVVLISVQAAVLLHGISMAEHVSVQGALAAARYGAGPTDGMQAAKMAANSVGAGLARTPQVVFGTDDVTVTVWIRVPRSVPLFSDVIARSTTVPRERFIAYVDR